MKLFVYGTLKKGYRLNSILKDSRYIGKGNLYGTLHTNGFYPILTFNPKKTVYGEIYEVDKATLQLTDQIEFGAGYKRKLIDVQMDSLKLKHLSNYGNIQCYVYYQDNCDLSIIEGGNF